MHTHESSPVSAKPTQPPTREPYVFGPIALFRRALRWHAKASLWQVLLVTLVLLVLIVLVWSGVLGLVRR